jgi:ATP-dependent helicase/nuclease subunit A
MNLHQCKGLEAPFVFLVDPSGDVEHDVSVHIDRSGEQPRGYLPIYGLKRHKYERPSLLAHPPGWSSLAEEEQRFLDAEANRLLYVAATRAGVKLVISQRDKKQQFNSWRQFENALHSASNVADPGPVKGPAPVEASIDPLDWQREVAAIDQRWTSVLKPTYAVQAVKESTIHSGIKPHGVESGGAQWGEVLHTLLESAMRCPGCDLEGLAIAALEKVELPITLAEEAAATVKRVIDSALWQRAQRANRRLAEVPLSMFVAAKDSASELPTIVRGVIDLAFLESAGWVIVDYKSERVGATDLPALVSYYRSQVIAYADAWEKIVGQPVVELGLFFTHAGEYVIVER